MPGTRHEVPDCGWSPPGCCLEPGLPGQHSTLCPVLCIGPVLASQLAPQATALLWAHKNAVTALPFARLDEALSQYFGEGAEVAQQEAIYPTTPEPIRKCPQCSRDMVLKTRKNGGSVPSCPTSACSTPATLAGQLPAEPCCSVSVSLSEAGLLWPTSGPGAGDGQPAGTWPCGCKGLWDAKGTG